ncbi:MAG: hypothetical protein KME07_06335 [Pegethrix bostrychoides GSE-TBD4-15B]|jgi:hypothetical protein|uniref:Uncharacterized protein n=1 Tax=Pegethrix bostrychoides GSE-TBD4-15B TaxID=2839662 RepID=A0A951P971_9CYAN|nr:hypothetical protein [Pegethrix bostrychoides GSE-TBD4-15B]
MQALRYIIDKLRGQDKPPEPSGRPSQTTHQNIQIVDIGKSVAEIAKKNNQVEVQTRWKPNSGLFLPRQNWCHPAQPQGDKKKRL